MKDIYVKLLLEMMGQCKRSDRELAKSMRVSQPTVTRARRWLEANGYITEYTLIPDFAKIGLELVAFTLIKARVEGKTEKDQEESEKKTRVFLRSHSNVVMGLRGEGLGCDGMLVSLHKDFAEFTRFMRELKVETTGLEVVGNFLASLTDMNQYRQLTFKRVKDYVNAEEQE